MGVLNTHRIALDCFCLHGIRMPIPSCLGCIKGALGCSPSPLVLEATWLLLLLLHT